MDNEFLVFSYSRAQALEDGVLVDVTAMAQEAGFRCPVAVTTAVWNLITEIPEVYQGWQDVEGRLWDVLWTAWLGAYRHKNQSAFTYDLILATPYNTPTPDKFNEDDLDEDVHLVTLKVVAGPGDKGELVVTLMLPNED